MAIQTKTLTANGSKAHHKFTLSVTEESARGNRSVISHAFIMSPLVTGFNWSQHSTIHYSYSIGDETFSGDIPNYNGSSTVTLNSGSLEIEHDANGAKEIAMSFSVTDGSGASYTCGSASASDTMALTTITAGVVYIDNGAGFDAYEVYIDNGTSWDKYAAYIDNGTSWDSCG